jgi:type 1 glutamine amidotransferase
MLKDKNKSKGVFEWLIVAGILGVMLLHSAVIANVISPNSLPDINIVLLADVKDHGQFEHDYPLWQRRWALLLGGRNIGDSNEKQVNLFGLQVLDYNVITEGKSSIKVSGAWEWPSEEQFKTADVIVAYCYLKWNPQRIKQVEDYLSRGGGFVVVHPASWTEPQPLPEVAKLIGISGFKLYRHGIIDLKIKAPDNPIFKGLYSKDIHDGIIFKDESYWPAVIETDIEVLATSYEKSEDSNDIKPQTMIWTHTFGKGRVFGCLLGHNTWTFDNISFRYILLRGIAWAGNKPINCFDQIAKQNATIGIPME